ncbi:MAG: hypothetical protein ACFFD1_02765 [Candidatus Thorarchaeota archaeon]
MESGKLFAILGGLLTLLGTYVFAIRGYVGNVGSGIGFIFNIGPLIEDATLNSSYLGIDIILYYILVVVFIIYLAAGLLQILASNSRFISLIFSLFPLGVGLMFIFLEYTDILGIKSFFFASFFYGVQYGNIFPFLINLGDLALGAYLVLAGGVLGFLSVFLPRED